MTKTRMQPEVSHDRAQPLGIDVRVARGCCDTLMAQECLHVAQVGSAFVEQERRRRMPKGMCGNDRHPSTLTGELDPDVECLVAKGSAVTARKDERRSREVHSPARSRKPFCQFGNYLRVTEGYLRMAESPL